MITPDILQPFLSFLLFHLNCIHYLTYVPSSPPLPLILRSYVATPAIFFAMALCVLEERGRMPLGGVLTPASAFYDVPSIFDRLALGTSTESVCEILSLKRKRESECV